MLLLQSHHIIDLYCFVDDIIPEKEKPKGGRPQILSDSEVVTILVWNTLVLHQKTLKDVHTTLAHYHRNDFPNIPRYQGFVAHCHRLLPVFFHALSLVLHNTASMRLMDATMLPVCKRHRADSHKVAKNIAQFGKNHQGWHYGFKLHASIDLEGRLSQLALTPANIYDAQAMPKILNEHCRIACGDTLYGARVMGKKVWETYGTVIIAPPWPKQKRKVAAPWQTQLLSFRSKIESVFDYLKEHLNLVSSFPRSVSGYVLHYVRILLAYQIAVGF